MKANNNSLILSQLYSYFIVLFQYYDDLSESE